MTRRFHSLSWTRDDYSLGDHISIFGGIVAGIILTIAVGSVLVGLIDLKG